MSSQIIINEVHPNQESDNEWIEFLATETLPDDFSLNEYTIFDNSKQIYKFTTEKFINQLLVVELSGLNNDSDSVILKNSNGEVIDYFTYSKTEKGLSWFRTENGNFLLGEPSKNQNNPIPSQGPSLSPSPSHTPSPNYNPSTSPSPSPSQSLSPALLSNSPTPSISQAKINIRPQYVYDLKKVKLEATESSLAKRNNRLVILSETEGQREFVNAIIGSSLIILSAIFIIYVKSR